MSVIFHASRPRAADPGCSLAQRLPAFDKRITQVPFNWQIVFHEYRPGVWTLRVVEADGIDNVTGERMEWAGRRWLLSQHMTDGEIAQTILKAILTAVEHEVRELLKFDGLAIFNPHFGFDALLGLAANTGAKQERTDTAA